MCSFQLSLGVLVIKSPRIEANDSFLGVLVNIYWNLGTHKTDFNNFLFVMDVVEFIFLNLKELWVYSKCLVKIWITKSMYFLKYNLNYFSKCIYMRFFCPYHFFIIFSISDSVFLTIIKHFFIACISNFVLPGLLVKQNKILFL